MTRTESEAAARWEARYAAGAGSLFGSRPNDYLTMRAEAGGLTPGPALLPADGDGRNGRWLAGRGWQVTAVERSRTATELALAADRAAGVTATREIADLAHWEPAPGSAWTLVAILYLHGPEALRGRVVDLAVRHLAPGGRLVLEGFATAQADDPAMGPDDRTKLYDAAALESWVRGLEIEELLTGRVRLREGTGHDGLAQVVRLSARRPA